MRLGPASAASTSATSRATSAPSSSSPWPTPATAPELRELPAHATASWTRPARRADHADPAPTRAYARAGLVGNPSDGYHGKTISLIVAQLPRRGRPLRVGGRRDRLDRARTSSRFGSVHDLVRDVKLHGYYGGMRLVKATIKKFVEYCQRQRASRCTTATSRSATRATSPGRSGWPAPAPSSSRRCAA